MDISFTWDENFLTGLDGVDDQHHVLIDLFNELSRTLFVQGADREMRLSDVYGRLTAYTEYHFHEEEEMMQRYQLDPRHVQGHRNMHQQFVEQIRMLWSQRSSMNNQNTTLVGFLSSWLGLHILGIDQAMARQIASINQGMTPAQAFDKEREAHNGSTLALIKMIGKLYTALSTQNAQLAQANLLLEARVAQRTQELEQANARLHALSFTDGLLGIANRACFNDRLQQFCTLARRQRHPVGLIMIDVDCFKRYNDHYGHLQGDSCLQAIARTIADCVQRSTDVVARYGGEELAVVLPDTDETGALHVAQRMVHAVQMLHLPHADSPVSQWVSISAGVCSMIPDSQHGDSSTPAMLIAQADAALYLAKAKGRNGCQPASAVTASTVHAYNAAN